MPDFWSSSLCSRRAISWCRGSCRESLSSSPTSQGYHGRSGGGRCTATPTTTGYCPPRWSYYSCSAPSARCSPVWLPSRWTASSSGRRRSTRTSCYRRDRSSTGSSDSSSSSSSNSATSRLNLSSSTPGWSRWLRGRHSPLPASSARRSGSWASSSTNYSGNGHSWASGTSCRSGSSGRSSPSYSHTTSDWYYTYSGRGSGCLGWRRNSLSRRRSPAASSTAAYSSRPSLWSPG